MARIDAIWDEVKVEQAQRGTRGHGRYKKRLPLLLGSPDIFQ